MNSLTEPAEPETDSRAARPPLVRELLLVVGLFLVYKFGRQLANGHTAEAFRNAGHVWSFERAVHLPSEGAVQGVLLDSDTLVHVANTYYATVHFPATLALLVFLYLRRPRHYVWTRRVLAALTAAALVLHLSFPLAPPRMLRAAHLVDTAQVYGPSVYSAKPSTDTMANQFAAMPSLHFGWALMVAIGLIVATRSRWRWLWLLHPLLTLLVVVGTANHYWLDALVATALLGGALAVIRMPRTVGAARIRRHLLPAPAHPAYATEPRDTSLLPAPWSPAVAFRTPPDSLSAPDVLEHASLRIPVQVSATPGSTSAATAPQLVTSGAR
ncbi:phosphatase PAP2 family protein [Streptomyces sp. SID14478]|uniref:phosphatase PAP2 family protein n=1 Tax=Streptomyces sp. SID14478 TaxID=2706073 RepID=UPI001EF2290E|nr:phosphatase PAP2 family protein [Streptomyces sp. SID14478]